MCEVGTNLSSEEYTGGNKYDLGGDIKYEAVLGTLFCFSDLHATNSISYVCVGCYGDTECILK